MRPHYETPVDLMKETRVMAWIGQQTGARWWKLPQRYELDFYAESELRKSFVEIKNRTCNRRDYPFYILALSKYMKAQEYRRALGLGTVFVFAFNDGEVCFIGDQKIVPQIVMHGRTDRDDPQDIEPCIKIPAFSMHQFRKPGLWES